MLLKILIVWGLSFSAFGSDLKILSWNVFMLPRPIKHSLQGERIRAIPKLLSGTDYDFLFFQEAFMAGLRKGLKENLKAQYPFSYYLKNYRILYPYFGSGVFLMGRHPFKVIDHVYYGECGGADCFAAKGAVLVETELPSGRRVQFVNTHLQAKETLGAVRLAQIGRVREMLKKHYRPGVPQIFIGDLNIDVQEPEFQRGMDILQMQHTELVGPIQHTNSRESDCFQKALRDKEWVDHVWVSRETALQHSEMRVRVFDFQYQGKTCPASDHHAVEAQFTFRHES